MKGFILLVRVPVTYSTDQAKAVTPFWNNLTDKWKAEGVFITSFVFPAEGYVIAEKAVKKELGLTNELKVVSTIILRAAGLEEAVELAKACPVLAYGGTIEVREIQPRVVTPADKEQ